MCAVNTIGSWVSALPKAGNVVKEVRDALPHWLLNVVEIIVDFATPTTTGLSQSCLEITKITGATFVDIKNFWFDLRLASTKCSSLCC